MFVVILTRFRGMYATTAIERAQTKCTYQAPNNAHRYQLHCNKQQCAWRFYVLVELEVIVLILAGVITQITQITSPSELHNRISECQGSHSLPPSPIGCEVVVLMSEAEGLPWRRAPRWHFKRTAHGTMKQSISNGWESVGSLSRESITN